MKPKFISLTLFLVACTVFAATCAHFTPAEKDLIVKITARRLGNYGAQHAPVPFIELGQIAQNACVRPDETLSPAAALEMIIEVITNRLDDPLLGADLKDLVSLLDIRLSASLKLIGLTEEHERLIKIAVCAFAQGVRLHPSPG